MTANPTIAAVATPAGTGGIGILRISGPRAWQIGQKLFAPAKPFGPQGPPARRMVLGQALDPKTGQALDQVLAVFFRGPASYTGEDSLELQGHSGPAVIKQLLAAALAAGAVPAGPGEFTQRAFLNGRMDLAQAEAVAELVAAAGAGEARLALASLDGGLSTRLAPLRAGLTALSAWVEAGIDFPEEVEEARAAELAARLEQEVLAPLRLLLAQREKWRVFRDGATVVFCGRPNVGKSSLFNALLGRERAIVTATPGTTRDTLEEMAVLGGVTCRLVDTAGLGQVADELDRLGQQRARASLDQAHLALVVLDGSAPLTPEDREVLALTAGRPRLVAVNKNDLPLAWRLYDLGKAALESFTVSARDGQGLDRLARLAGETLSGDQPEPEPGQAVASARQAACLSRALSHGEAAMAALSRPQPAVELASLDLQQALAAIGEVDGVNAPDAVIDAIFAEFCLGK